MSWEFWMGLGVGLLATVIIWLAYAVGVQEGIKRVSGRK